MKRKVTDKDFNKQLSEIMAEKMLAYLEEIDGDELEPGLSAGYIRGISDLDEAYKEVINRNLVLKKIHERSRNNN